MEKRGSMGRVWKLRGLAWVSLLLLAALLLGWHVKWPAGPDLVLAAPEAALRQDKALTVDRPMGEVRVNTAGVEELCTLKGVGQATGEAIIAERETNGSFYFAEDLLNVKGIGEKKLAGFIEQIRLE